MSRLTFTLLALATTAAFSAPAAAAPVASIGIGSAVVVRSTEATFEANTTLANNYQEGGLLFSHNGAGDNNGCGYAAEFCEANPGDNFSASFSGNYFGTGGLGAYVSISSQVGLLTAIEFAFDSGFNDIFGLWQTYLGSTLTGSGRVSLGVAGVGGVLGLTDAMGFDQVRIYALAANTSAITTMSAPAIDTVVATVPEPTALALALTALCGLAATRRRS